MELVWRVSSKLSPTPKSASKSHWRKKRHRNYYYVLGGSIARMVGQWWDEEKGGDYGEWGRGWQTESSKEKEECFECKEEKEGEKMNLQVLFCIYLRHSMLCYSVELAVQIKSSRSSMQVGVNVIPELGTWNASPWVRSLTWNLECITSS